jgi:cell division protein ZapA (FtsZ GTPase activity inhibitor)
MEGDSRIPLTTEISLLGERITLRTTDNDPEFTAEVIELVSNRLEAVEKRIQAKGLKTAPHQVTLLALLDLAEEYVRAKKRTAQYKAEIEHRCTELSNEISKELQKVTEKKQ